MKKSWEDLVEKAIDDGIDSIKDELCAKTEHGSYTYGYGYHGYVGRTADRRVMSKMMYDKLQAIQKTEKEKKKIGRGHICTLCGSITHILQSSIRGSVCWNCYESHDCE